MENNNLDIKKTSQSPSNIHNELDFLNEQISDLNNVIDMFMDKLISVSFQNIESDPVDDRKSQDINNTKTYSPVATALLEANSRLGSAINRSHKIFDSLDC